MSHESPEYSKRDVATPNTLAMAICDRFEALWKAGSRPQIELQLNEAPLELRTFLLAELLAMELKHRRRMADDLRIEEYLARFPSHQAEVAAAFRQALEDQTTGGVAPKSDKTTSLREVTRAGDVVRHGGLSPPPPDFPDTPRFVCKGLLGQGGMGRVYKAFDKEKNEDVALKILVRSDDPHCLSRFKDEFRLLGPTNLIHPNLVPVHELLYVEGCWFLTMRLVVGIDFCTYCRPRGSVDEGRLQDAFRQLTSGIAALHERGMLHCDIKPSNVMVSEDDGHVWILDFGLVTYLSQDSLLPGTEHAAAGTLVYMAPEQADGQAVAASDLYSMGVLLYQCLTGHLPFRGSAMEVLRAKLEPSPPSLDEASDAPEKLRELCLALLHPNPDLRPTPDMVLERLSQSEATRDIPQATVRSYEGTFCGRERELHVLRDAFEQVANGATVCVYVSGASGIGKSALVRRFFHELHEECRDAVVLTGRCYEMESIPFKAFDNLVDILGRWLRRLPFDAADALTPSHAGALARIFPVLRRVEAIAAASAREAAAASTVELRNRAFTALRDLLFRLGQRYRLVIAIDDLQWADADSLTLLASLFRLPNPPNLLFLGCYRTEELENSAILQHFFALSQQPEYSLCGKELRLQAMTDIDTKTLVTRLLQVHAQQELDAELVDYIAAETLGHPLFVRCYLEEVIADPQFRSAVSSTRSIDLEGIIWNRVTRLPADSQRQLQLIAIAGHPLRERDLLNMDSMCTDPVMGLKHLRGSQLVRGAVSGNDSLIDTYHDRIRETVMARMPRTLQREHHLRIAETLERADNLDYESLGRHFSAAGRPRDASKYFTMAAQRASIALAFDQTVQLYQQALQLCDAADANRSTWLASLADALVNSGCVVEAASAYVAADELKNGLERHELRRRAFIQYLHNGDFDQGMPVLLSVLKEVGIQYPTSRARSLLSLLLVILNLQLPLRTRRRATGGRLTDEAAFRIDTCWSVAHALSHVDTLRGAIFTARHLLLALNSGDKSRIARGLALLSGTMAARGRPSQRRSARLITQARQVAAEVDDVYIDGWVSVCEGIRHALLGHWKEAYDCQRSAESHFDKHCPIRAGGELSTVNFWTLWCSLRLGSLQELQARWPDLIHEAHERGDSYGKAMLGSYLMAMVSLCQGRVDGIEESMSEAVREWTRNEFHVQHHLKILGDSAVLIYRDDHLSAYRLVRDALPRYRRSFLWHCQMVRSDIKYLLGQLLVGSSRQSLDANGELRQAKKVTHSLAKERMPWTSALAYLQQGRIHAANGDRILAANRLMKAIPMLESLNMNLHATIAKRELGWLRGGTDGLEAVAESERWLRAQGVADPARFATVV